MSDPQNDPQNDPLEITLLYTAENGKLAVAKSALGVMVVRRDGDNWHEIGPCMDMSAARTLAEAIITGRAGAITYPTSLITMAALVIAYARRVDELEAGQTERGGAS